MFPTTLRITSNPTKGDTCRQCVVPNSLRQPISLQNQRMRCVVNRPRLETAEEGLPQQKNTSRIGHTCSHTLDDDVTNFQALDAERVRLHSRSISQSVLLSASEISACDCSGTNQRAHDIRGNGHVRCTTVNDKVKSNSVVDQHRNCIDASFHYHRNCLIVW